MISPIERAYGASSRIAGTGPIGRRGGSIAITPTVDRPGNMRVLVPVLEQLGLFGGLALAATAPVWVGSDAVFRLVDVLFSPWLD